MLTGKGRSILYLLIALAMLIYALPRLDLNAPWDWSSVFGMLWLGFALVIIAAHVNVILLTEERRKELARIKRAKANLWERRLVERASATKKVRG
ncbi:hypothetical protein FHS15_001158 [Paenibacillus castaneae]|uniref:hypothetical protein n=1 Tax=Paenibacillus castaneae TaxID=474957 RepID=UPI000C9A6115|nr:hypothetical protein [Paenibacillus castaneae]NIK76051.1 hypothetical protein [Paenibacillus castaneae]